MGSDDSRIDRKQDTTPTNFPGKDIGSSQQPKELVTAQQIHVFATKIFQHLQEQEKLSSVGGPSEKNIEEVINGVSHSIALTELIKKIQSLVGAQKDLEEPKQVDEQAIQTKLQKADEVIKQFQSDSSERHIKTQLKEMERTQNSLQRVLQDITQPDMQRKVEAMIDKLARHTQEGKSRLAAIATTKENAQQMEIVNKGEGWAFKLAQLISTSDVGELQQAINGAEKVYMDVYLLLQKPVLDGYIYQSAKQVLNGLHHNLTQAQTHLFHLMQKKSVHKAEPEKPLEKESTPLPTNDQVSNKVEARPEEHVEEGFHSPSNKIEARPEEHGDLPLIKDHLYTPIKVEAVPEEHMEEGFHSPSTNDHPQAPTKKDKKETEPPA